MRRFRIIRKRERWGLTIWGWLVLILFFIIAIIIFVRGIIPFLTPEHTLDSDIMIVEGYVPDYAFPFIIKTFNEKNYKLLITSGVSFDQGFYITGVKSAANLIYESMLKLGFDSTKMVLLPLPSGIFRDRTYNTALYIRKYFKDNNIDAKQFNLISLGVHSRRSLCLYKMVFEPKIKVGNIVITDRVYNSTNWYKSSRGFRTVLNETIGYFYVKCFFWPSKDNNFPIQYF